MLIALTLDHVTVIFRIWLFTRLTRPRLASDDVIHSFGAKKNMWRRGGGGGGASAAAPAAAAAPAPAATSVTSFFWSSKASASAPAAVATPAVPPLSDPEPPPAAATAPPAEATLEDGTAADALEAASSRLAQVLRTPADLHLVEQLQKRFEADKAARDSQLKALVRSHLDSARAGIRTVQRANEQFRAVKAHFAALETLGAQSSQLLAMYPLVKRAYDTHARFAETAQICDDLAALPETFRALEGLIEADTRNLLAARHLLYVFRELVRLDQLRASLLARAGAIEAVRRAVRDHFRGLPPLVTAFEQLLWSLAGKLFQLARKHHGTIVKIAKIVEAAEHVDRLRGGGAAPDPPPPPPPVPAPRGYLDKLRARIAQSVEEHFEGGVAQFAGNVEGTLRALNLMNEDLTLVMDEIAPRFPPAFGLFEHYVACYHTQTVAVLDGLARGPLDPKDILLIFNWVEAYHRNLHQRLGVDPQRLHPRLLDEQVPKLIGEYVQLVHRKVEEWTGNLLATETRDFQERAEPPKVDDAGLYRTEAPTILFQMVNQQVDLAARAGREGLLQDVVLECCDVLAVFTADLTDVVRAEERKYLADPEKHAGLLDYTMAFVNSMASCSDYTVQLLDRLKADVRGASILILEKRLGDIEEGFRAAAKAGLQTLAAIVFRDVQGMLDACFTPRWYDGELVESVVATLEDYANSDLQAHLQEYYFNKFMNECLDRVLVGYVSAAVAKPATLKGNGQAAAKVASDARALGASFGKYIVEKRVARALVLLQDLGELLSALEPPAILAAMQALRTHYPDAPQVLVDAILHKRHDLPRDGLHRALADLAALYAETPATAPDEPSVAARVRLPA